MYVKSWRVSRGEDMNNVEKKIEKAIQDYQREHPPRFSLVWTPTGYEWAETVPDWYEIEKRLEGP